MPVYHWNLIQGSVEWKAARLGKPTASEFHRIITASKGDLSKSARKYAHALMAETILDRELEKGGSGAQSKAMERGTLYEPAARAQYEREQGVEVRQCGLVTTNCGRVGASPDGLILPLNRGLEIKCTLDENHVGFWDEGPGDDYKQQVQGNLAINELEVWDLYGYHPNLPAVLIRTYRDEPYIKKMNAALVQFLDILDGLLSRAVDEGWLAHESPPVMATFAALKSAA